MRPLSQVMTQSSAAVYLLSPGIVLKEMDGQTVLFSKNSGEFFGLNETAARFVTDLLQYGLEAALVNAAALYNAGVEELRGDFNELINDLIDQGLLQKS